MRVRVRVGGAADARVGAAGELAAEVVLLVGGDVTAQHRGGHHAVDAEQVLDRVGRGLARVRARLGVRARVRVDGVGGGLARLRGWG